MVEGMTLPVMISVCLIVDVASLWLEIGTHNVHIPSIELILPMS